MDAAGGNVPVTKELVLLGGGHSHLSVLYMFGMKPVDGVRVTLISRDIHTPYSGMLPGYVSGFYSYDDCHIDLSVLSTWSSTRLIYAEATGIDIQKRKVLLRDRPPVSYDVLSIDIGITPAVGKIPGATEHTVPVKPIFSFVQRFESLLARVKSSDTPMKVVVVGGGAGGVELALALQHRLEVEREASGKPAEAKAQVSLLSRGPILQSHIPFARRAFLNIFKRKGVELIEDGGVTAVEAGQLLLEDGRKVPFNECLWCTQATAAPWLANTGLTLGADGFILISDTLQCAGGPPEVFAVGDVATSVNHPKPKAGVFAVRQGPPLADNLRRFLLGQPLHPFIPQSTFLSLISTGDRYCVGTKGWIGMQGGWLWWVKDWIDRSFMYKFSRDLPPMDATSAATAQHAQEANGNAAALQLLSSAKMRCGGCGSKVGASVLSRVLSRLPQVVNHQDVVIGLHSPDDAAVLRPPPPGHLIVQTVDFMRSCSADPFVFGAVVANHALGDCYAMGATPVSALAVAAVPFAAEGVMEDDLTGMISGAVRTLNAAGCALVGGHTCEGKEQALGFCIHGTVAEGALMSKGGLQVGDALLLTKPLGTGVILAAGASGKAKGRWVQSALEVMQQSNQQAAEAFRSAGVGSCTDVSGFGLLGHAAEMARASQVLIEVDASSVPLLDGAEECVEAGVRSTLHEQNAKVSSLVDDVDYAIGHAMWPLLLDPQTGGGLLAGVAAERAQDVVTQLQQRGYPCASIIGRVVATAQHGSTTLLKLAS